MKQKSSKRSVSTKHLYDVSLQTQAKPVSKSIDSLRTISSNKIEIGTGPADLQSYKLCLKAKNILIKNPKQLKRDLLRCSNQRPSLLGSQTLQTPRITHSSQQNAPITVLSPASSNYRDTQHHHSLSINYSTPYTTVDRIGPWPDMSITRARSDGNELLRPLRNLRNIKNPRMFSPKYYTALHDNASHFQFHSSTRSYIEEYRKNKGYHLETSITQDSTRLPRVSPIKIENLEDDQLSDIRNSFIYDPMNLSSRVNLSLSTRRISKSVDNLIVENIQSPVNTDMNNNQTNRLPTVIVQKTRQSKLNSTKANQESIALPALSRSSLKYIDSIKSVKKVYDEPNKITQDNQSKVYYIHGHKKKRNSSRLSNDSEITTYSYNHSELAISSSTITAIDEEPPSVVMYQLPRRMPVSIASSDIG